MPDKPYSLFSNVKEAGPTISQCPYPPSRTLREVAEGGKLPASRVRPRVPAKEKAGLALKARDGSGFRS